MQASAAVWHLLNFFAPALVVGLLSAALAKLLWREELKSARWARLAAGSGGACALVLIAGLIVFGHDGMMATYAAMLAACAATLWWLGFGPARR